MYGVRKRRAPRARLSSLITLNQYIMEITTTMLKELRDVTGVSVMQCKKALEEAQGDMGKAKILLLKKSSEIAAKKSDRELGAGAIGAYIHNNEIAGIVVLSCETDFVSKNEEYVALARDIAMQVAAQDPRFITREDVDEVSLGKARTVFAEEVKDKPEAMQEKILEGKLNAYWKERVLMEQLFIKDETKTISDLIASATQKFGERIVVTEMKRFSAK